MRTFGINSPEFYEAVTQPPDPWCWGPCLPREPRKWDRPAIVEGGSPLIPVTPEVIRDAPSPSPLCGGGSTRTSVRAGRGGA